MTVTHGADRCQKTADGERRKIPIRILERTERTLSLPSVIIYRYFFYRQWASCVKFLCQVPSTRTGPLAAPRVDSPRTDSHLCLCAKRPARSGTRQRSVKRRCGTRTPSPHALESSLPPHTADNEINGLAPHLELGGIPSGGPRI